MSSRTMACSGREVDAGQQLMDGLGAHAGVELIAMRLDGFEYISSVSSWPRVIIRHAWIDDDEGFEIKHALDLAQRHVQHQADA